MNSSCRFTIPAAGGSPPSEQVLQQVYVSRLRALSGQLFAPEGAASPEDPDAATLVSALVGSDRLRAESAAIVAGLCRAEHAADDEALDEALRRAASATGPVAIEASTALVRRGQSGFIDRLQTLAGASDPYDEPFRAAQILAELGHPERLEVMAQAIIGPIQADRGLAARGLSLWAPYTDDATTRARLVSLLEGVAGDPNPMVRREMPTATERLGLRELEATLRRLSMEDADAVVRLMAGEVLERWGP